MSARVAGGEVRQFKGVWIPAEIWMDRSLSINEKVMLMEIDSLQDEVRGCFASNARFAKFFDLSISRVSEIIGSLAEKGRIHIELIRDGKQVVERRIRLVNPFGKPDTPSENAGTPFGKGDEPPSEKAKESNTSLSNTGREGEQPSPSPTATTPAPNSKIPYQQITDLYNRTCGHVLPRCMSLTDKRRKAIASCWNLDVNGKRPFRDLDFWEGYFADAAESAFLTGANGKGWRADFDFLTRASAAVKILEGSYDR